MHQLTTAEALEAILNAENAAGRELKMRERVELLAAVVGGLRTAEQVVRAVERERFSVLSR